MFFKLVSANSKRSRKENGLFFSSLVTSIIAFYIILSLSRQDVMIFLTQMESDAVGKLLTLIPAFYVLTLVILFFLIYFAGKYQLERRSHEFGVYLTLGMRRGRLFFLLLAEDLKNSLLALLIGIPGAVAISELISLVTARAVGLGIIGHTFSFSLPACCATIAGFLAIKLAAFLLLSGKISRREIGDLLNAAPEGAKKQHPAFIYCAALLAGTGCLAAAYAQSIRGYSWKSVSCMGITLALGFFGTLLLFYGLRMVMAGILKAGQRDWPLRTFHFRQLQEGVICQSRSLAVACMLMIAALCCFGSGISFTSLYSSGDHLLDYTFYSYEYPDPQEFTDMVRQTLEEQNLSSAFSSILEIKIGYAKSADYNNSFRPDRLLEELQKLPDSPNRDILLNNLTDYSSPHLISLDSYNALLSAAGQPAIALSPGEAAVYMGQDFTNESMLHIMDQVLELHPDVTLEGQTLRLTGPVRTENIVTDRSISLLFALILPDEDFDAYTRGDYSLYINGILQEDLVKEHGLLRAILDLNQKLDKTGLPYESYLQNMGRQLFYLVAASYLTIYLAIIFLIVANTLLGVQFLMSQQKTRGRYKTLIRLGADYELLRKTLNRQIRWYFGIPVILAAINSIIASRALIPVLLIPALLFSGTEGRLADLMRISIPMIFLLCVVEWIYLWGVQRAADRYLLTLMAPEREE